MTQPLQKRALWCYGPLTIPAADHNKIDTSEPAYKGYGHLQEAQYRASGGFAAISHSQGEQVCKHET
jgi:hypothetical protein